MTDYRLDDVKTTAALRNYYGDEIVLIDEQDESVVHKIVAEFAVGGRTYVVLRVDGTAGSDDVEIFRASPAAGGEWELETIEDDDEWENISELYDEMTFQP